MKIASYNLERNSYEYYTSRGGEFYPPYADNKPTLVIEKHFNSWRAQVFTDKYCENCVFYIEGNFNYCVKLMREYFNPEVQA